MATKGTIRDILEILRKDGWVKVNQKGSHRQFKHPSKPGKVTVDGKEGIAVDVWLWNSMLRQAGLKR